MGLPSTMTRADVAKLVELREAFHADTTKHSVWRAYASEIDRFADQLVSAAVICDGAGALPIEYKRPPIRP